MTAQTSALGTGISTVNTLVSTTLRANGCNTLTAAGALITNAFKLPIDILASPGVYPSFTATKIYCPAFANPAFTCPCLSVSPRKIPYLDAEEAISALPDAVAATLPVDNAQTLAPLTGALLLVSYTVIVTDAPTGAETGAFIANAGLAIGTIATAVGTAVAAKTGRAPPSSIARAINTAVIIRFMCHLHRFL